MKKKKSTMEHKFDDGELVFKDDRDMGIGTIVRKKVCYEVYWHDLRSTTIVSEEHVFSLEEKKKFDKVKKVIEKERKLAIEEIDERQQQLSPYPWKKTATPSKKIIYKVSQNNTGTGSK